MTRSHKSWGRHTTRVMLMSAALTMLIGLAPAAAQQPAQATRLDPRWQAWLGCWTPVETNTSASHAAAQPVVCVIPATGTSTVDFVRVVDGRVVGQERIDVTHEQRYTTKDSCAASQRAGLSSRGRRVYIRSVSSCHGTSQRTSTNMLVMVSPDEWLDIQGIATAPEAGAYIVHYAATDIPPVLAALVTPTLRGMDNTIGVERIAETATSVTTIDVIDALRSVDAPIVEAWLTARRRGFSLDARALVALADAHVPDRVIDLMVALSYPDRFAIASPADASQSADLTRTLAYDHQIFTSMYGVDDYSMYGYSPYGYSPYGWNYYSQRLIGSAYGPGYPSYLQRPVIIIVRGNGGEVIDAPQHGRVVKGQGYTRGTDDMDGVNVAQPPPSSTNTERSTAPNDRPAPSDTPASNDKPASASGAPTNPPRTAKPRP